MSTSPVLPGAPRHWSTDVVRPAERLDYWVGVICEAFLEMACDSRAAPCFDGSLTHWPVQDIGLNRVVACAQDVYRTRAAIARDTHPPFYLITQLDSAWHVRQGGQVLHLRPGDVALVDAAQAYELHFPGAVACLSVELPRDWVGRWLREVDVPQARVAYRDQGWGQTLSALCLQLGREPVLAGGLTPVQLDEHLGAMVAAALEPGAWTTAYAPPADLHGRALACMRERLGQAGLSATEVAHALGVSPRTLHRAFAAQGGSVMERLRQMRLQHARVLLAQPRLAGLGMAEVGRRCGYGDVSHFVRDFHRAAGTTPARWRRERMPN